MAVHRISYASDLGWGKGESASLYAGGQATYDPTVTGFDIFRTIGALRTGYAATEIGGATIDDQIWHLTAVTEYTAASATRCAFGYSSGGKLYKITDETTPVVTLLASAVSSPVMGGLVDHKNYIYYPRATNLGRWGSIGTGSSASNDGTYVTGLAATAKGINITHPLHSWNGKLYYGDSNLLKYVLGSETTGTTGTTAITLDADHVITAITDNGTRLYFGAGIEPDSTKDTKSDCFFYVWDGTSTNFNERYPFPEPYIHKIRVVDNTVYVFGRNYLYRLVGSSFQIVQPLGQRVGPGGVAENRNSLFWKDSACIRAYGSPDPQIPKARYSPFASTGTDVNAIIWMEDTKFWYADNNNLYECKTGSQTGNIFRTKKIAPGQLESIDEVRIYLTANLASGDDVRVLIYDETGGTSYNAVTFDFATYGAVNQFSLRAHQFTEAVPFVSSYQIGVKMNAGAAVVREVIVFTNPPEQP